MKVRIVALVGLVALLLGISGSFAATAEGVAVEGLDRASLLPPAGATVEPYENAGYRLRVTDGTAKVEIDTSPIESEAPFEPPDIDPEDPVARLAGAVTAGERTRFDAASKLLGWVARNVDYELDRDEPQDAHAVLERRSGYCTGVARLAVALLEAVGIEAREVAGYVVPGEDVQTGGPAGYHRWIELELPDVGWLFSDPLSTHFYVPATYLRIASEQVAGIEPGNGLLLERDHRLAAVDLFPGAAPGVTVRRNHGRQLAAALRVHVGGRPPGVAVLEGKTTRYTHVLDAGEAIFVGLDPGRYTLRLLLDDHRSLTRTVELASRVRSALYLPPASLNRAAPPAASDAEEK